MKTTAILVAAGNSTRMGGVCKQLISVCGRPVLYHTLRAFEEADRVDGVVLVCREQEKKAFQGLIEEYRFKKVLKLVTGGETRQASVAGGIGAAPSDTDFFAIHDGARCLITHELIDAVIEDAAVFKASAAGVPVKDTIKVVSPQGIVASTPDRSTLWAVQTPQVFERPLYLAAMEKAISEGRDHTDDCQLIEQNGGRVHMCMGSYDNIKVTTVEDITLAEAILQKRGENI